MTQSVLLLQPGPGAALSPKLLPEVPSKISRQLDTQNQWPLIRWSFFRGKSFHKYRLDKKKEYERTITPGWSERIIKQKIWIEPANVLIALVGPNMRMINYYLGWEYAWNGWNGFARNRTVEAEFSIFNQSSSSTIPTTLPSGNLLHSYWKWPSRNSWFTQL